MENTKTVKQWIESIEDEEVRSKAINNLDGEFDNNNAASLSTAIAFAFVWSLTDEGHEYWDNYYHSI